MISNRFFNGNDFESPLKISGERTRSHGGLVPMSFLFDWVIFGFQPLIFRGVPTSSKGCCLNRKKDRP